MQGHQVQRAGFGAQVLLVAGKDLEIEWRSRVAASRVVPFAGILLLLFAVALDPDRGLPPRVAPGLFWHAATLAALLAIGRAFAVAGHRAPFLVAALLAAANAVLTALRVVETRTLRAPITKSVRARASHGPTALLAVGFLCTVAFGTFETTFALLGARRMSLTITGTSVVFLSAGVLVALANARLVGPTVRRFGDLGALRLGLALDTVGLALVARANSLLSLAVAITALAIGHGLTVPVLASAVSARVPPELRGAALGSQQAAASLARVAGPVAAGSAFGLLGPATTFLGAAAIAFAAVALTPHPRGEPTLDEQQAALEVVTDVAA